VYKGQEGHRSPVGRLGTEEAVEPWPEAHSRLWKELCISPTPTQSEENGLDLCADSDTQQGTSWHPSEGRKKGNVT
jgi:hypothetical protein